MNYSFHDAAVQAKRNNGIRWPEDGRRPQRTGFKTKTEARRWFAENIALRLDRGAPSAEITFDEFCEREAFGSWTLAELEGATDDAARWCAGLTDGSRYRLTSALRQALGAAMRWHYISRNPAVEAGSNPQPRSEELLPFTAAEIDAIEFEIGPAYGPLVVFAAETGLRTNEWAALERRDVDRSGPAIVVERRYAGGRLTPYPKTPGSRRRVPLSARALAALDRLPPRLDAPMLFPASRGGHIGLDTWRTRHWYPALDAAGTDRRGPSQLRHTFATEALAAGISIFELARIMGTSVEMIDRTYGHLARDSEDAIRIRLDARAARNGVVVAPGTN